MREWVVCGGRVVFGEFVEWRVGWDLEWLSWLGWLGLFVVSVLFCILDDRFCMIFVLVEVNVRLGLFDIDGFFFIGLKVVFGLYFLIVCDMMYKLGVFCCV